MTWSICRFVLCCVLGLGLVSCATSPSGGQPLPSSTVISQPIVTPEPTHTATATIAPSAQSTSKSTPAVCNPHKDDGALPDLSALHWDTFEVDGHRVRQLAGLNYPINPLNASPDGRWLVVAVQTGNPKGDTTITSWPEARAAIAVIAIQGDAHWWMNTNYYITPDYLPRIDWLPDGRLLWVDETYKAFVGAGQNRRELNAPVVVHALSYASNNIAFARVEDGDLWRVDLASRMWEKVTTARPPQTGGLGGYFLIARDGSYVLAIQSSQTVIQMWQVPTRMGAPAEPLPDVKIETNGHGGPSGPIPTQLADGSYWLLQLRDGLVVDTSSGKVVTAPELGLSQEYQLREYNASPDGKWLAVTLWRKDTPPPVRGDPNLELYVTPTEDLKAGRVLKGVSVAGWHTDAPAAILKNNTTGELSVARLPLTDTTVAAALSDAAPPLTTLPDMIFATDTNSPARLLQFDLDGNQLAMLDLTAHYDSIQAARGALDQVYLGVKGRQLDNTCTYALVEWAVGP